MTRKKGSEPSRFAELFSTSENSVVQARKRFESEQTSLVNARTYGTEIHAVAAAQAFVDAADSCADAMRMHAHLVVDYAKERVDG